MVFSVFDYTSGHIVFDKAVASLANISEAIEMKSFSVYPNPANQFVSIDINENDVWKNVVISDLSGKTVLSQEVSGSVMKLQLGNLGNGMYIISLQSETASTSSKLIIKNN
jgi:hypothetical protein